MFNAINDGGIRMLTAVLSIVTTIENVDDHSANNNQQHRVCDKRQ